MALTRDFIVEHYVEIKKAAGRVPILIREANSVPARAFFVACKLAVVSKYEFFVVKDGAEEKVLFEGMDLHEVARTFSSTLSKYSNKFTC